MRQDVSCPRPYSFTRNPQGQRLFCREGFIESNVKRKKDREPGRAVPATSSRLKGARPPTLLLGSYVRYILGETVLSCFERIYTGCR